LDSNYHGILKNWVKNLKRDS